MRVRELRARTPPWRAVGIRLALEHQLAGAAPPETLLPLGAWLCIRQLNDPQPRALSGRPGRVAPPPAWQKVFHTRLSQVEASAARPQGGVIAANAEAVLFRHLGELMACFAQSWCAGRVTSEWWWSSLLGERSRESWPFLWERSPQVIPVALAQTFATGDLPVLLLSLAESESRCLIAAVVQCFGLATYVEPVFGPNVGSTPGSDPMVQPVGWSGPFGPAPVRTEHPVPLAQPMSSNPETDAEPVRPAGPSESTLRALLPDLSGVRWPCSTLAFVAIGLVLHRAPERARAADFGRQVALWIQSMQDGADSPAPREITETGVRLPIQPDSPDRVGSDSARSGDAGFGPPTPWVAAVQAEADRRSLGSSEALASTRTEVQKATEEVGRSRPVDDSRPPPQPGAAGEDNRDQLGPSEILWTTEFSSSAGGIFYLANVALALGLYGDFTQPRRPGIGLPFWDFLALVGDRVLGPIFRQDRLWEHLAVWSGRDPLDPPGGQFAPPEEWRMSPEWLAPFSGDPRIQWVWLSGKLRAWHGAGFVVLDLGCPTLEAAQKQVTAWLPPGWESIRLADRPLNLRAELPSGLIPVTPETPAHQAVQRWLARLVPYLQARIRRALPAEDGEHLLRRLIQQTARVEYTPTEIVVHFELATHPLGVRLAGLDRDPGWVPAAGRSLSFVYE